MVALGYVKAKLNKGKFIFKKNVTEYNTGDIVEKRDGIMIIEIKDWQINLPKYKSGEKINRKGKKIWEVFIEDEIRLQKKFPDEFRHLIGKPLPEEYRMKGLH